MTLQFINDPNFFYTIYAAGMDNTRSSLQLMINVNNDHFIGKTYISD